MYVKKSNKALVLDTHDSIGILARAAPGESGDVRGVFWGGRRRGWCTGGWAAAEAVASLPHVLWLDRTLTDWRRKSFLHPKLLAGEKARDRSRGEGRGVVKEEARTEPIV